MTIRDKVGTVKDTKVFGGFPSALELQDGFSKKLAEGVDVIDQLIEGARRLQEAYMRADRTLSETDKFNADRMTLLGESGRKRRRGQMNYFRGALSLAVVTGLVGACTGGGESSETVTSTKEKPVIAATVKPAPEQPSYGNTPVRFEPCFELGDATIMKAGFDAATRERSDQVHYSYAFIGCTFDLKQEVRGTVRKVGSLTLASTNVPLDEFRKREGDAATDIKINGRDATSYQRLNEEALLYCDWWSR
jgi:hypothetical protein